MSISDVARSLILGAVAGTAATWLMDLATTVVQKPQPAGDARREEAAWPNGQPSVVNLVNLVADRTGVRLEGQSRDMAVTATHYALGAIPGAGYALVRDRVPGIRVGHGLAFGALLWAVNDEYLNTRLGLAGPWSAYPLMTHVRGLIGHLVLGVGTHLGINLLAGVARLAHRLR